MFLLAIAWILLAHPQSVPSAQLVAGGCLVLLGELLRVWATGHLCKNQVVTVGGPYRHLRDPMYLGSLMIATGLFLTGGNFGLIALFLTIFILIYLPRKQRRECRRLLERFGMEYAEYLASVSSLVPRLRPYRASNASSFSLRLSIENNEHGIALLLLFALAVLLTKIYWAPAWLSAPPWLPSWL